MGPDLDLNCLKGLSADDNVMPSLNKSFNTSIQLQLVITSKSVKQFGPLSGPDRFSGLIGVQIV